MARPRIGISCDTGAPEGERRTLELGDDYAQSVIRAGGLPVLLPHTHDAALRVEMIGAIDALLIPGGRDLHPSLFAQDMHAKTRLLDQHRQANDLALLALAEARQMPTLGICLGCQMINVFRRGTLHQHLPEALPDSLLMHSKPGEFANYHDVTVRPGTKLAAIMGQETLQANSRHHQGIAKVGHGLVATAYAADGLVEAVEDPSLPFFVAVQWHPENLAGTVHEKLFAALVESARKH